MYKSQKYLGEAVVIMDILKEIGKWVLNTIFIAVGFLVWFSIVLLLMDYVGK